METSNRLSLPLLVPGQAQKEITHNEALVALDILVAAAVGEPPRNDPPPSPGLGDCYIVGTAPTGLWSRYADHLACFTQAGWRFAAPVPGLTVTVNSSGLPATYSAGGWQIGTINASRLVVQGNQVVGPRAEPVSDPLGGNTVDEEARSAVVGILSALRQHGLIASA